LNKRKLTRTEKRRRKVRKAAFEIVFLKGRMKRVRKPKLVEGLPVDEFIARNADPIWLHQNELWYLMPPGIDSGLGPDIPDIPDGSDDPIPF
jgi:hypothetical protein